MSKARFNDADIAGAIAEFTATNQARIAPAVGKNSSVTVYGENKNPYKPVIPKESENGSDETISGLDIGIAPEGADGLGDSPGL